MSDPKGPGYRIAFFRRRTLWVPAWPACLLAGTLAAGAVLGFFRGIHPFLAVEDPRAAVPGDGKALLVLEGWLPDYGAARALERFRAGGYRHLVVTGGPLPPGHLCASHGSYAARTAQILSDLGLGADSLSAVPSPRVDKDRTYAEGLALAAWMDSAGISGTAVDVMSLSAHARRSRRLYALALGTRAEVGAVAVRDLLYDPARWWRSSEGAKHVLMECVSYAYTCSSSILEPRLGTTPQAPQATPTGEKSGRKTSRVAKVRDPARLKRALRTGHTWV